jgi:hypothetical protein
MSRLRVPPFLCAALAVAFAATPAGAQVYAVDFVATAATGATMSPGAGVIAGNVTLPPACNGCSPTFSVPAIWANGQRHLLDLPAGSAYITFAGISPEGWVAGSAMSLDATRGRAMLWRPAGNAYEPLDLGTLPGEEGATVAGIDDQHRVFGTSSTWTVSATPFVWTPVDGMSSLIVAGYPAESPVAVSPAGTIATTTLTYRYGDPASVEAVAPAPPGYFGPSFAVTGGVNDDGVRASFLLSTSSQSLRYLARYSADAGWQIISGFSGSSSRWGVGSIDALGTVTGTVLNAGVRAVGPDGVAASLAANVSPAYGPTTVTYGGDQAADGSILAGVSVGRSERLVRLVPAEPCAEQCARVASLTMTGRMISERGKPGQCTDLARNTVSAKLLVTDENGLPLRGATVRGRFLDDYYLDSTVTVTTNRKGIATAKHDGPPCVGAIAFLVEGVDAGSRTLDRTTGVLTSYVIPQPRR